jgi:uncharacterized membrane-anchored protein YhcB (DUF1043 family)
MHPTFFLLLWFAGGAAVGALLVGWLGRRGARLAEERAAQLERDLEEARGEADAQAERIARHFARTSDLFRELTERYTQLYAHLADGARQFCTDEVPAIARGFEGALLGPEVETEAAGARPADRGAAGLGGRGNGGSPPAA